ncbi:hypothetical protein, partial [Bradyrhizobium genomosp. I (2014)]|uniref:hypothetical protein n=1 Tax=Bradyrhizobium genomosp. I (2014) TaxID=2683269 RepID=UPI00054FF4F3
MTKTEKLLEQARIDLDATSRDLLALELAKAEASKTSAAFAKWRSSVDEKTSERERLEICVSTLEIEVEQQKKDAARADLVSRRVTLEKQTAALARRITDEGAKAAAALVQLAEESKSNAMDVERLNRELSDDEQLVNADILARHRAPQPRENLDESVVDLWVYERTNELVSDPDSVVERSYERGYIPGTEVGRNPIPVVRRRFRQIRYIEGGERSYVEPLATVLRLA